MGGANATGRRLQQSQQGHHTGVENDHLKRRQHESQNGHEIPEATEDVLRQENYRLARRNDKLRVKFAAQEQQVAFYRNIISDSSWNEMCRRMQGLENQLQQSSAEFEFFARETSRVSHEHNQRLQHESSTLDRLTEIVFNLGRESKAFPEGCGLESDAIQESEKDEFVSTADSEENPLRRVPRMQKKKARADLRSQAGNRTPPHSASLQGRLVPNQEAPHAMDGLVAEIPQLRNDLLDMHSKLKVAQEHIVNIGGNLGALLPREEVENGWIQEFKSLVSGVQIWITTFLRPAISNPELCFQATKRARPIWRRDAEVRVSRSRNQEFRTMSRFAGADESVFLVLIFDLLVDKVFSSEVLYGNHGLQKEIDVIKKLELSMRVNSVSLKNLYNSRRWMSEAVTAIMSRGETESLRAAFAHVLTGSIVRDVGLEVLIGHSNDAALEEARASLRQEVVMPAIELGDKIACAIDKYSLEIPRYWTEPCMFQSEFFRDLPNLDCKNFGEGPPRFRLEKMRTKFSDDEISNQLKVICPAIPALVLTEAGDGAWDARTILVKQQVWVSWQPKKKTKRQSEEKGYFWFLYHQDRTDAGIGKA